MYVVYVLYSKDFDKYYVGMTTNLVRRLQEHNTGRTKSTKAYMPWHIVYEKTFAESTEARAWEKYLKTASGRRWRKENIRPRTCPSGQAGFNWIENVRGLRSLQ